MSCSLDDEPRGQTDGGESTNMRNSASHPPINSLISAMLAKDTYRCAVDTGLAYPAAPYNEYGNIGNIIQHEDNRKGEHFDVMHKTAEKGTETVHMDIDRPSADVSGPLKVDFHILESEKPRILDEIFEQVGSHQVSRAKLQFAPSWILDDAFQS